MLNGKWRYLEMFFAALFGEWKTFRVSDNARVRYNLVVFLRKLGLKGTGDHW